MGNRNDNNFSERETEYKKQIKELTKKLKEENIEELKKENNKLKELKINLLERNFSSQLDSYKNTARLIINELDIHLENEFKKYLENDETKKLFSFDLDDLQICTREEMETKLQNIVKDLPELELKERLHFNIIVQGLTGAGKSTLINKILNQNIKTGIGLPITKSMEKYENEKSIFRLFDTRGVELEGYNIKEAKKEITEFVERKFELCDTDNFIHCIWYLMNPNCNKYQKCELDYIQELKHIYYKDELPIFVVISQAFNDEIVEPFIKEIEHSMSKVNINHIDIIKILANDYTIKAGGKTMVVPSFGIKELLKKSFELSKKSVNSSFYTYYKKKIEVKIKSDVVYESVIRYKQALNDIFSKNFNMNELFQSMNKIFLQIIECFIIDTSKKDKYIDKKSINIKIIENYLKNAQKWKENNFSSFKKEIEGKLDQFKPNLENKDEKEKQETLEQCYKDIKKQLDTKILNFIILKFCDKFTTQLYKKLNYSFERSYPIIQNEVQKITDEKVKDLLNKIEINAELDKFN